MSISESEIWQLSNARTYVAAETGIIAGGDRMLEGVGRIVDYEPEPTVTIERMDGTRFTWRLSRVDIATEQEVIKAQHATIQALRGQA